jgi:hypothetical protein
MLEQETDSILAALRARTIGDRETILLREVLDAEIPRGIKTYIQAETTRTLEGELFASPRFSRVDRHDPGVRRHEQAFITSMSALYSFPRREYLSILENAVHFLENFLCRPQWTIENFVFESGGRMSAQEVVAKLDCTVDYAYFKMLIQKILRRRGNRDISAEEFRRILVRIDDQIVKQHNARELALLAKPIFDFLLLRDTPPDVSIPLKPILIFFEDKKMTILRDYIESICSIRQRSEITLDELTTLVEDLYLGQTPTPPAPRPEAKAPVETEVPIEPAAPVEAEVPVEAEPPVNAETPVEAEVPVEAEPPVNAETPVEAEAPVEAEPPVNAETPVEAEAPVEAESPAEAEAPAETAAPSETPERLEAELPPTETREVTELEEPNALPSATPPTPEEFHTYEPTIDIQAPSIFEYLTEEPDGREEEPPQEEPRPRRPPPPQRESPLPRSPDSPRRSVPVPPRIPESYERLFQGSEPPPGLADLRDLIQGHTRSRFVKRLFNRDEARYEGVIASLNNSVTWREASLLLNKLYMSIGLDPFDPDVVEFTDAIHRRYLDAEKDGS